MAKRRLAKKPTEKEKRQTKSRWTTWAVLGGLAVVVGAIIAVLSMQSGGKAGSEGKAHVGKPAPDFTLRLFNGQSVTLSSLKGKPVLVNFWASS